MRAHNGFIATFRRLTLGVVVWCALLAPALPAAAQTWLVQPPSLDAPPSSGTDIPDDLDQARDRLWAHYRQFPPGGGWRVTAIEPGANGRSLEVRINMPATQVTRNLLHASRSVQESEIRSRACPPGSNPIWRSIDAVRIRTSLQGNAFRSVVCRGD
jgi:hypothetical protein